MDNIITRHIGSWDIKQRTSDGYVHGNTLAASLDKDMNDFLKLAKSQKLIKALSIHLDISENKVVEHGWLHPLVALNLAYWLSPQYSIIVFEWVKEWLLDDFPEEEELSHFNKSLKQALNFNPKEK